MRHLALVSDSLAGGGAERVMATLANYLARRHRVSFITLFHDLPDRFQLDPGVERIALQLPGPPTWRGREFPRLTLLNQGLALGRLWTRLRPDAALTFMETANFLGGIASLRTGVPLAISERCHPKDLVLNRFHKKVYRQLTYRLPRAFIAQSQATADWARQFLPKRRIHVLPNPIFAGRPEAVSDQRPVVLSVGRLAQAKGQPELLEAFASLASQFPDWKLRLVGEGPLAEELQQRALQPDLLGRVEWAGWCHDMDAEYRRASVFAHLSHSEGQPNVVLEALWHGLPCLVSDCFPGCRQFLKDGQEALVVPIRDGPAARQGLYELLSRGELRARLGQRGQARVAPLGVNRCGLLWEELLLSL
ncbi:MAG: glycosyltransferase [Vulcanimicrobiota bacterium]